MATFKDRFSDAPDDYARYRPTYPRALALLLAERAPDRRCAVEVGCGSGQLSLLLAETFDTVVATDASAAQIASAPPHPRIRYRVAPAENTGLPSRMADLIVAAQAAHWFDLPAFFREARRIGKPGALVALVGYGLLEVGNEFDPILRDLHDCTLKPYWSEERWSVVDGYSAMAFPLPEEELPPLSMYAHWTLDELVGYLRTWSGMKAAEAQGALFLPALRAALADQWGPADQRRVVSWPLFMRLGRLDESREGKS